MPLICPLTNSVRLDSDKPLAAGTTGKISVRNGFVSRTVDFAVTRCQVPERLCLEMRYGARSAQSDYLFRDAGTGTTVTLVTDAPAVGPRWLQGWNRRALERPRTARRPAPEGALGRSAEGLSERLQPVHGPTRADRLRLSCAAGDRLCDIPGVDLVNRR